MRRVVVPLVMAVAMAACSSVGAQRSLRLQDVPAGVSFQRVHGRSIIFVRADADALTAFVPDARHMPGESTLWWCPPEQVFASPTHGEIFDMEGRHLDGPATGDLNRVPVTIEGDRVTVGTTVTVGATRGGSRTFPMAVRGGWNKGKDSFCKGAIKPSH